MRLFRWFKSLWETPEPTKAPEGGMTRRGFLTGLTAAATASFIAPSLPPVPKALIEPVSKITGIAIEVFDAQWDIIEHVQQRVMHEIMAAEDARFLAYVDAVLAS